MSSSVHIRRDLTLPITTITQLLPEKTSLVRDIVLENLPKSQNALQKSYTYEQLRTTCEGQYQLLSQQKGQKIKLLTTTHFKKWWVKNSFLQLIHNCLMKISAKIKKENDDLESLEKDLQEVELPRLKEQSEQLEQFLKNVKQLNEEQFSAEEQASSTAEHLVDATFDHLENGSEQIIAGVAIAVQKTVAVAAGLFSWFSEAPQGEEELVVDLPGSLLL